MSAETFIHASTFVIISCAHCNCQFAVTLEHNNRMRENGRSFYCPSGHSNVYRTTQLERLKAETDRQRFDLERAKSELAARDTALARAKRKLKRAENRIARTEIRIANGVCPCCNRHFTNLERHMKTKHAKV